MAVGAIISGVGSLINVASSFFGGNNEQAIYEQQKAFAEKQAAIQNAYQTQQFLGSLTDYTDQYNYQWDLSVQDYQNQIAIQEYEALTQQKLYQKQLGIASAQLNLNDLAQDIAFATEDFNLKNLMKQTMFSQESELIALQNAITENELNKKTTGLALSGVEQQQELLDIQKGELGLEASQLGLKLEELGIKKSDLDIAGKALDIKTSGLVLQGEEAEIQKSQLALNLKQLGIKKSDLEFAGKDLELKSAGIAIKGEELDLKSEDIALQSEALGLKSTDIAVKGKELELQKNQIGLGIQEIALQKLGIAREEQFIGQEEILLKQKDAIAKQFIQNELTESQRQATFEKQGAYVETLNKLGTVLTQQSGKSRGKAEQIILGEFFRGMSQLESTLTGQNRQAALRLKELQTKTSFDKASLQLKKDKFGLQTQGLTMNQQRLAMQAQGLGLNQAQLALQAQGVGLNQQQLALQLQGMGLNQQQLGLQAKGVDLEQMRLTNQMLGLNLQQQGVGLQGQSMGLNQQQLALQAKGVNLEQLQLANQMLGLNLNQQSIGLQQQGVGFAGQKLDVQGQQLGLEASKIGLQEEVYNTALQNAITDNTFNMKVIDAEVMQAAELATLNKQKISNQKYGVDLNAVSNIMIKPTNLPAIPPPTKQPEQTFIQPPPVVANFVAPPSSSSTGKVFGAIGQGLGAVGKIYSGFEALSKGSQSTGGDDEP